MTGRLHGMVAIVTGSASGIGRACAVALGLEGAAVVVADLHADGAVAVADHIVDQGGRAHGVRVDLGDAESVEALVQHTVDRFGGLDILHNNAAATHLAATRDLDVGDTGHTAYAVSKAAINALTLNTAAQYGKSGVRCNAVAPGLVVTPASADNYAGPLGDLMLRHHLTPRLGTPDDIAAMVTFLCSPEAGFVTGQIINVDGGSHSHAAHLADIRDLQAAPATGPTV